MTGHRHRERRRRGQAGPGWFSTNNLFSFPAVMSPVRRRETEESPGILVRGREAKM